MRYLIAGDDVGVSNLARAAALLQCPSARLGRARSATPSRRIRAQTSIAPLAGFSRDFFAVEAQGFDLLDALSRSLAT